MSAGATWGYQLTVIDCKFFDHAIAGRKHPLTYQRLQSAVGHHAKFGLRKR